MEQAFEREKRFSANVSHELKTPLATMITNAQVLKLEEAPTPEDYEENLNTTLQSAQRLSEVINGLLLLYRANREQLNKEPLSLAALFESIQKELAPPYKEKNIAVRYQLSDQKIEGNEPLLYRALGNILENAYKYTNENGEIGVTSRYENGTTVLCITDNGIGMTEEDQAHMFEPFYRADKSRSRKESGAGLGLAIVKEVLALHEATISVESAPHKGTSIVITFTR